MPTNITDVDEFTAPVQAPANGDLVEGPTPELGMQDLANRTRWLKNRIVGANSGDALLIPFAALSNVSSRFSFSGVAGPLGWTQTDVTDAGAIYFDISPVLPLQGTLTTVVAQVAGGPGHTGTLPSIVPILSVFKQTGSLAGATTLGSQADTSADGTAYELYHSIPVTGLAEAFDHADGNRYYARLEGEAGTNKFVNLVLVVLYALVDPA